MTDRRVVLLVVRLLGGVALLLTGGSVLLAWVVVQQAGRGVADPSSVAVLATVTGLSGTTIGALATLLVSTRSQPQEPPPPL